MPSTGEHCTSTKHDGSPCQGTPRADGTCFAHSPELAARREAARRKGGQNRAAVVRLQALVPPGLRGVYQRLDEALAAVQAGELDHRRGAAMAAIARAMVAVMVAGETEERVRRIEEQLERTRSA